MARKPVHLTAAHGRASRPGRQGIWEGIRQLRRFTIPHLEHYAGLCPDTIRTYLRGLEAAGYIRRDGVAEPDGLYVLPGEFRPIVYELVRDVGIEAPRVTKTGKPITRGAAREQMWRTAKILREFSWRDLAVQASTEQQPVAAEDAKDYARYLHLAGYLACVAKGRRGTPARYRFLPNRNTGPLPPMIQSIKQVWDPNLCKVMWRKGDGDE